MQSHADKMVVACLPLSINDLPTKSCRVVAQYDDMVTILRGAVFEDRWLTMPQFRRLLERVDARMEAARKPE